MPRVSEEHLERRRQQILDAAQTCFAGKGLHATTMQDVFAESGLSAGAVYRYFKSKDEIIAALTSEVATELHTALYEAVHSDPLPRPAELIRGVAEAIVKLSAPGGPVRLIPQTWALALTDPQIADYVRTTLGGVRRLWHDYALRMRDVGWLPVDADTDAVAKTMFGILPGFMLQHLIMGDVDPGTVYRGIELLVPVQPREASVATETALS